MLLRDALSVQRGDVIAFTGAGGKTSALFRLAWELRSEGWRVLATTTTRMAASEARRVPLALRLSERVEPSEIKRLLSKHGFVFLYSRDGPAGRKVIGLSPQAISNLLDSVNSDVLLIEADGARRLPLKVPYEHEPVVPPDATLVVSVAGMDALDQPLDEAHVYNATRLQARYGFPEGGRLIPPWMAVAIRDPELGMRGIPDATRVVVLLNKVKRDIYSRRRAERVAQLVLRSTRIDSVALGAMRSAGEPVFELRKRVTAIVLAAGVSSRMGVSKVLLPWDDEQTVIEAVVSRLIALRLHEIVVVTGHRHEDVVESLSHLPVRTVFNPNYARAEMLSSLQRGLQTLDDAVAACLVVMGDQPSLSSRVADEVLAAFAKCKGEVIAPTYRGQRGHPVLIGRRLWPDLLSLERGAPRDVIQRYPERLHLLEVGTDSILRDIDTPEAYQRERRLAGLD